MNKVLRILLLACGCLLSAANVLVAQNITTLDWDEMRIDSVLPVYSEVVPLESDYRLYSYSVTIEYPEWAPLNTKETEVCKQYADHIGEELDIRSQVTVSRKAGMLDIAFHPLVFRDGRYFKLLSGKMVITPQPKPAGPRCAASTAERYTRNSVLSSGKWVKISVTEDGIYRLTASALKKMGFTNPANVHVYGYGGHRLSEVSNPETEYDDLQEVPLYPQGSDSWLFWGNGLVCWDGDTRVLNPYATSGCYFLTETEEVSTPPSEPSLADTTVQTYSSFTDHVLYEKDEFAWFSGGRNLFENVNYASSNTHTYKLSAPNCLGNARLAVLFTAGASSRTTVTPAVNGTSLASFSINALSSYTYGVSGSKTYDVSSLATGGNDWTIKLSSTSGNDARLDYLALHYTRKLAPVNGFVAFSQDSDGPARFAITGSGLAAMRLPSPQREGAVIQGTQASGAFSIVVDDATARYVAFDPSYEFPQPSVVGEIENQNLHALDSVDMVILIPESNKLAAQAQRLAEAHYQYDGLRTAIVRADQVYNEFSSGTPDATAYRRLMKMLYDRAASDDVAPRYLLLMGDCAWDNRMLSSAWKNYTPKDYLLCFESENSFSDTKSYVMEDYFGLLDDGEGASLTSDKTDLGVGRFPVTTEAEAKILVDKSIAFLSNSNAGSWKNVVSVLGDDGDNNVHMRYADDVAERIIADNPEMEVRKVMWDAYTRVSTISHNTYPAVTSLIKQQLKDGALVMNYTGHAATYCLSHEFVLQLEDFASFQSERLPLWMTAACDVMPFDGQSANIGETAVLNDGGAAVAFFGTARTVYAYNNLNLNRWFMHYLFATDESGRRYRLGDAIRLAKNYMIDNDLETSNSENKLHYALLGDPALTFGAPVNRVVLDSINGQVLAAGETQLQAGQLVRMSGHVENASGDLLSGFSGILSARVYDNLETVTCLNNAAAEEAFTFTSREKILFNGQDSVSAGRFNLSFVMPADINFSDQSGRVVFYAVSNDLATEANGYSEAFTVGGASEITDTIGPSIYAYLNTEDFENGGRVNSTPYFVAQLEDESGISYSGSGLGHDLLLTIDNDPASTYVLNDCYTSEFGDYTRGTAAFSIPELADGAHSLTFRAWDVLNNTSQTALDFMVDSSLRPTLFSVALSQNPALTTTTFLISHDRAGSECDFVIEVFDFAGRRLWRHQESGSSSSGLYAIPWDLTMNGGGRLFSGVYLYRVTLRCGSSKSVSQSQKIIVHGNN